KNPDSGLCSYVDDVFTDLGGILTLFQDEGKGYLDDDICKKVRVVFSKYFDVEDKDLKTKNVEDLIEGLLEKREDARESKNWNVADGIRDDLEDIGLEVQDTDDGPVWRIK
ncbi:MAG: hypothetical protein V5A68_07880, partial [Candidatus Thermoplasmatota archaeon]